MFENEFIEKIFFVGSCFCGCVENVVCLIIICLVGNFVENCVVGFIEEMVVDVIFFGRLWVVGFFVMNLLLVEFRRNVIGLVEEIWGKVLCFVVIFGWLGFLIGSVIFGMLFLVWYLFFFVGSGFFVVELIECKFFFFLLLGWGIFVVWFFGGGIGMVIKGIFFVGKDVLFCLFVMEVLLVCLFLVILFFVLIFGLIMLIELGCVFGSNRLEFSVLGFRVVVSVLIVIVVLFFIILVLCFLFFWRLVLFLWMILDWDILLFLEFIEEWVGSDLFCVLGKRVGKIVCLMIERCFFWFLLGLKFILDDWFWWLVCLLWLNLFVCKFDLLLFWWIEIMLKWFMIWLFFDEFVVVLCFKEDVCVVWLGFCLFDILLCLFVLFFWRFFWIFFCIDKFLFKNIFLFWKFGDLSFCWILVLLYWVLFGVLLFKGGVVFLFFWCCIWWCFNFFDFCVLGWFLLGRGLFMYLLKVSI